MAKSRTPAQTKEAKAEAKAAAKVASKKRRSQLWQAFQMQRREDRRLLPYMIGGFVAIVAADEEAVLRERLVDAGLELRVWDNGSSDGGV